MREFISDVAKTMVIEIHRKFCCPVIKKTLLADHLRFKKAPRKTRFKIDSKWIYNNGKGAKEMNIALKIGCPSSYNKTMEGQFINFFS